MMNTTYYKEMLKRNRLMPFIYQDKLICFISFYIDNNIEKFYNRVDGWQIMEDNPQGSICYIDQLITDKTSHKLNSKLSYIVWKRLKNYIRLTFPSVKQLVWRRFDWNKNIVRTYKKEI